MIISTASGTITGERTFPSGSTYLSYVPIASTVCACQFVLQDMRSKNVFESLTCTSASALSTSLCPPLKRKRNHLNVNAPITQMVRMPKILALLLR